MQLTQSREWFERGIKVIPLATQTLSKSTSQFVQGVAPVYVERGEGPYLYDVDGNRWIDYIAALATIREMDEHRGYEHLWREGERLRDGLNRIIAAHGMTAHIRCRGLPHHTVVDFLAANESESLLKKSLFQQECLQRGLLFLGVQFTSLSHTDPVIDETLAIYDEAMRVFARVAASGDFSGSLVSEPVKPVFRSRV